MCAMLPKSNCLPFTLVFGALFLLSCSKPKDHLDIINPYANQVKQMTYEEIKANQTPWNIYPYKAIGLQLVDPDTLAPNEYCILDGTDTLNYKEFETAGDHSFLVVNSSGDTMQNAYFSLFNQVTRVWFYNSVFIQGAGHPNAEIWKPIRVKTFNIPPFYSEHYEIRDFALNKIFSSDSFDSAWTAKGSLGPYYYFAQYVDWYGQVHERKGEIVSIQ